VFDGRVVSNSRWVRVCGYEGGIIEERWEEEREREQNREKK
jgi:hypothetical protein